MVKKQKIKTEMQKVINKSSEIQKSWVETPILVLFHWKIFSFGRIYNSIFFRGKQHIFYYRLSAGKL